MTFDISGFIDKKNSFKTPHFRFAKASVQLKTLFDLIDARSVPTNIGRIQTRQNQRFPLLIRYLRRIYFRQS